MDTRLLARADTDGLAALRVADRIRLCILQRDKRDEQIALGVLGKILALCNNVGEHIGVDLDLIAALLEGNAEHLLCLNGRGDIILINGDDVVAAFTLLL